MTGVLVGGEPVALLAASSALHEVATRTDDVGRRLAAALAPAATTVMAAAPFAPGRVAAVLQALHTVTASPLAGLAAVGVAYEGVSLQLRHAGQALEAAGAVGLLASGGLGLLRGRQPTVLASAEGIDLRREAVTGSWSVGPVAQNSNVGVREVRRPDGTTFFVVEVATGSGYSSSFGIQVNGVGGYAEGTAGGEVTRRWAVPTRRDAELLLAMVTLGQVPGGPSLPTPTELSVATVGTVTAVGAIALIPGSGASGRAAVRHEVTFLGSGAQRFSTSLSGAGQASLAGVTGTGGSGSVKVTVQRSPSGVVDRLSVTTTTEVDRGRSGQPLLEAGNREATLVEREVAVELTPERRAAAGRIADALARGEEPAPADLHLVAAGPGITRSERTYDVRHQAASVDVSLPQFGGGAAAGVDIAELRRL